MVKNLPACVGDTGLTLGQEDPVEKEMATHSSIKKKKKRKYPFVVSLVQFSSDDQLCLTLWDPMDCSTSGFPGLHYLPEFAQTHVH